MWVFLVLMYNGTKSSQWHPNLDPLLNSNSHFYAFAYFPCQEPPYHWKCKRHCSPLIGDICCSFRSIRIQSKTKLGATYLSMWIHLHTLSQVKKTYNDLVAKARPKIDTSFSPHPPKCSGLKRHFQFTKCDPLYYGLPFQRKLKQNFLIQHKIPFGMSANKCQ
jgi:hypothetical protein